MTGAGPSPGISILGNVLWVGAGQAGRVVLQLVSVATLARLLVPSDYGLMAIALTVTGFMGLVRDLGTSTALIQGLEVSDAVKNSTLLLNVVLGSVATLVVMALSPVGALAFDEPGLSGVLLWMAPVAWLGSVGAVQQALLERAGRLRAVSMIELGSGVAGLLVAVALASSGRGVYALVAQAWCATSISSLSFWVASDWRPRRSAGWGSLSAVWKFGWNVVLFNVANFMHRNVDVLIIGRLLGPGPVGHYNVAYRLLLLPLATVTGVVGRAALPAYSRSQSRVGDVGGHYLETLSVIAFLTAPSMAFLWSTREAVLETLLGPGWASAAGIVAWLAPVGVIQSVVGTSGTVFNALGRSDLLRNLGLFAAPYFIASYWVGVRWGVDGVACAYCIANVAWVFPVMGRVARCLELRLQDILHVVWRPIVAASTLALVFRVVALHAMGSQVAPAALLSLAGAAFFALYALASRRFWPRVVLGLVAAARGARRR